MASPQKHSLHGGKAASIVSLLMWQKILLGIVFREPFPQCYINWIDVQTFCKKENVLKLDETPYASHWLYKGSISTFVVKP